MARGEDLETVKAYQDNQAEECGYYWSNLTFKVTADTVYGEEVPYFYLHFLPGNNSSTPTQKAAHTPAPTPAPTPVASVKLEGRLPSGHALTQMNEDATIGFTLTLNNDGSARLDEGFPEGYFNYQGTWRYENSRLILNMNETATALDQTIRIADGKAYFVYFGESIPKELKPDVLAFIESSGGNGGTGGSPEVPAGQAEHTAEPSREPTGTDHGTAGGFEGNSTEETLNGLAETDTVPEPAAGGPVEVAAGVFAMPVVSVDADSWIKGENPGEYVPEKMIDGNEETCWQFSTRESKIKETFVRFYFSEPVNVDELWIKNGFWTTTNGKDQYTQNCRVKDLGIAFQYEGSSEWTDKKTYKLKDDTKRQDWQRVDFGKRERVTGIRFRIMGIYTGKKYKTDVCISEVLFVSHTYPDSAQ